jgi:hypothetical protein
MVRAAPTLHVRRLSRRSCSPVRHEASAARSVLAMPITFMTAPSVITATSANHVRRAKQPSGIARARSKSGFMAKCVCLWLRRPSNSSSAHRAHNAIQKISEPKAHVECTAELTQWLAPRIGSALSRRVAQVCCPVVRKGCCDVSASRQTVTELSAALLPPSKLTTGGTTVHLNAG